ncbi:MAG: signal peptidase I [Acidimicrobiales bacterium]|nr:signal peptidase I [Acidimicrobiales bacterium]
MPAPEPQEAVTGEQTPHPAANGADTGAAPATQSSSPVPGRSRTRKAVIEWGAILVVAVLAAVILRTFIVQPYFIPSGSMEPTLKVGDKVLVNKLSYDLHSIHRGDVVVFKKPPHDYSPGIKDLIKRVIGLPNETISASNGSVYINGQRLNERWLPKGTETADFAPVHVPAGQYFVMGDNRGNSADSRVIGTIPKNLIVGRTFLVVWPISHIGTL